MAETQLDRIENMLKILIEAQTTIQLSGTEADAKQMRDTVKSYSKKVV